MEIVKHLKRSLERFLKKPGDKRNNQIVNGWYQSYDSLERYAFNGVDKEKLKEELKQRILPHLNPPQRSAVWWLSSAAAVVIIGGFIFYGLQQNSITSRSALRSSVTKTGTLKYLVLPDGSEVWLNASSTVRYPAKFDRTSRIVYLPQGEAFFKVKRNVSKPFKVNMGKLEVQVLGTSFNLNNYADLESQSVVVNTGKVQVSHNGHVLAVLEKGKQLLYHKKTGQFELSNVNQSLSHSWKEGKTVLQNANFETLASVFKNLYGVKLKPSLNDINRFNYTLTILRQVTLEDNLMLICKMHHINYRKEGNVIVLY